MVRVRKGPHPNQLPGRWAAVRAHFRALRVGSSVLIPKPADMDLHYLQMRLSSLAAKLLGPGCYRLAQQDGGVRVWRLAVYVKPARDPDLQPKLRPGTRYKPGPVKKHTLRSRIYRAKKRAEREASP